MLILQIPRRVIKIEALAFPADVSIQASFGPPEVFGEAELSGRLRGRPLGQKVEMKADMFSGGIVVPAWRPVLPNRDRHASL